MLKKTEPKNKQSRRVSFDQENEDVPQSESLACVADVQRELEIWDSFLHPQSKENLQGEVDFAEEVGGFPTGEVVNSDQADDRSPQHANSYHGVGHNGARKSSVSQGTFEHDDVHQASKQAKRTSISLQEVTTLESDVIDTLGFKNKILLDETRRQSISHLHSPVKLEEDDPDTLTSQEAEAAEEEGKSRPRSLSLQITDTEGVTSTEVIKICEDNRRQTLSPSFRFSPDTERLIDIAVLSALHQYERQPELIPNKEKDMTAGKIRAQSLGVSSTYKKEESLSKRRHTVPAKSPAIEKLGEYDFQTPIEEESVTVCKSVEDQLSRGNQLSDHVLRNKPRSASIHAASVSVEPAEQSKNKRRHTVAQTSRFRHSSRGSFDGTSLQEVIDEDVASEEQEIETLPEDVDVGSMRSKPGKSYSMQVASSEAKTDPNSAKRRNTVAKSMRYPQSAKSHDGTRQGGNVVEKDKVTKREDSNSGKPVRSYSMQPPSSKENSQSQGVKRRQTYSHSGEITSISQAPAKKVTQPRSEKTSPQDNEKKYFGKDETNAQGKSKFRSQSMHTPSSNEEPTADEKLKRRHTFSQGSNVGEVSTEPFQVEPTIKEVTSEETDSESVSESGGKSKRSKSQSYSMNASSSNEESLKEDPSKRRHTVSGAPQKDKHGPINSQMEPSIDEASMEDTDLEVLNDENPSTDGKDIGTVFDLPLDTEDLKNFSEKINDNTDTSVEGESYEGSGESSMEDGKLDNISKSKPKSQQLRPTTPKAVDRKRRYTLAVTRKTTSESSTSQSEETVSSDDGKVIKEDKDDQKKTKVAFTGDVSFKEKSDFRENKQFGNVRNDEIHEIYSQDGVFFEESGETLLHSTPSNQCAWELIDDALGKGFNEYATSTENIFSGGQKKKRKIKFDENVEEYEIEDEEVSESSGKSVDDVVAEILKSAKQRSKYEIKYEQALANVGQMESNAALQEPTAEQKKRKDTGFVHQQPKITSIQLQENLEKTQKRPPHLKRKDTMEISKVRRKVKVDSEQQEVTFYEMSEENEEAEEEEVMAVGIEDLEATPGSKRGGKKKRTPKRTKNKTLETMPMEEEEEAEHGAQPTAKNTGAESIDEIVAKLDSLRDKIAGIGTLNSGDEKVPIVEIVEETQSDKLEAEKNEVKMQGQDHFVISPTDSEESNEERSRSRGEATNPEEEANLSAKHLVSDTLVSALDELGDEALLATDARGDEGSKKDKGRSSIQSELLGLTEHLKPMHSASSFDKTAAEFLSEPTASLMSNAATIDSKTTRSFTSSSGTFGSGIDLAKKTRLEEARKRNLARRNTAAYSRGKRASTARPAESNLSARRNTTHSSAPPHRGASTQRKYSQWDNSRMQKSIIERNRRESIDQLANFMGSISSDENYKASRKKHLEFRQPIKEHIEPTVVETPEPPSMDDFIKSETKFEKNRRVTIAINSSQPSHGSMSNMQFIAFRKLFNKLHKSETGGITADELYYAIQDLLPDMEITYEETKKLVSQFDIKGTGEIDFDEFLFAMLHPTNYIRLLSDEDKLTLKNEIKLWEEQTYKTIVRESTVALRRPSRRGYSIAGIDKRKSLFFKMLKTAAARYSIKEIPEYYATKIKKLNDHVIQDWSAGQRCQGLSVKDIKMRFDEIKRQLMRTSRTNKDHSDSPYAIPLYWDFDQALEFEKQKTRERQAFIERAKAAGAYRKPTRPKSVEPPRSKPEAAPEPKKKRPATAKPVQTRKLKLLEGAGYKVVTKTYPPPNMKPPQPPVKERKARIPGKRPKISEFVCTPKMVPLPTYPLKNYPQTFDYHQLPEIRHKTAIILEDYYNELKKVAATNARDIFKKLHVEQMQPRMRKIFSQSYGAYSGQENEPFVVSPWIPFPEPSRWMPYPPLGESYKKQIWNL